MGICVAIKGLPFWIWGLDFGKTLPKFYAFTAKFEESTQGSKRDFPVFKPIYRLILR